VVPIESAGVSMTMVRLTFLVCAGFDESVTEKTSGNDPPFAGVP
jgi:hypothetical protein